MNMAGVSRAMALNITYALWGVLFGALFTDVEITRSLVIGAAAILRACSSSSATRATSSTSAT